VVTHISNIYSIGIKPDIAKSIPVEVSTTRLNIETAVANVLPWKTNPSNENPAVNRETSPTPSKKAAIDKGTRS